jgi:hypothetical protein
MKTTYIRLLIVAVLSTLSVAAALTASESRTQILNERDRVLSQILKEQEDRRATGHSVDEEIFAAKIALYSFRRDSAAAISDKLKHQQVIVAAHEERLAGFKGKSAVGAVANVEVLRVTDGFLHAKQVLEEIRTMEKRG